MSTPTVITISELRRREEILAAAARHGAHDVRVYGSVARGEADERRALGRDPRDDGQRRVISVFRGVGELDGRPTERVY
ncbi:MAG TPA: hypothetical protein VFD59_13290 [Nocardioidaceae bacterium]|nr:hypothetical protein [Nocardioidaceae bacterium]